MRVPRGGDEGDGGVVGEQGGGVSAAGEALHDVAAERAAVLVGDGAGPGGGLGEQREVAWR